MDEDQAWLEGIISIEAALATGSRDVRRIYIRRRQKKKHDRRLQRLQKTAASLNLPIERVDQSFFAAHATGKSHGGVMAAVGPRRLVGLIDLVAERERPFIVMLDGLEDPFNFGQAIRSLYAAGVDGLVVRPRNWLSATAIVARASAGASEWMPMAVAETAVDAAKFYKKRNLTIACTAHQQATSIYEADLTQPLFLMIGGERRGITRSFQEQADLLLQIPYSQPAYEHALGVAASAAILSFEVMRQRLFRE